MIKRFFLLLAMLLVSVPCFAANEIKVLAPEYSGKTLYMIVLDEAGDAWNGSAFATFTTTQGDFDVALSEVGSTGLFLGSVPGTAGLRTCITFLQAGGSPASTDQAVQLDKLVFDGTGERTLADLPTADSVLTEEEIKQAAADGMRLAPAAGSNATGSVLQVLGVVDGVVDSILEDTDYMQPRVPAAGTLSTLTEQQVADAMKLAPSAGGAATGSVLQGINNAGNIAYQVEQRLTTDRAELLEKLDVSGTLAHTGNASTFMANVSGLSTFNPASDTVKLAADQSAVTTLGGLTVSGSTIAASGDWSTFDHTTDTVSANLTQWKGSTPSDLVAGKVSADAAVSLDPEDISAIADAVEIDNAAIAGAVRTELTTELGRIDADISSRLAASGYTAPLDAAGTRSALGMATANMDTQFSNIPTAQNIWEYTTRALTDKSGFAPSTAAINTAIEQGQVGSDASAAKTAAQSVDTKLGDPANPAGSTIAKQIDDIEGGGGGDPSDWETTKADITAIKTRVETNLDAKVSEVAGGLQPANRLNYDAARAYQFDAVSMADGTYKAVGRTSKEARFRPGAIAGDGIPVQIHMDKLFGTTKVKLVGTPTISGGSLTATALGVRETSAMIMIDGTATAGEEQTCTVDVTMDTGETVPVTFDIKVFAD